MGNNFLNNDDSSKNIVGICMRRTPLLIETVCYCYANGITYVPLEPTWPMNRMRKVILDAGIKYILTSAECRIADNDKSWIAIDDVEDLKKIQHGGDMQELAYILYTSGSTGEPKGVAITRKATQNFMEGLLDRIPMVRGTRIACLTPVTFDIFFVESIFAKWIQLDVALANEVQQNNPREMAKFIANSHIEILQMTPSRLRMLINYDPDLSCLAYCKIIMVGGEQFPLGLLHILQAKTQARIYNMYGPTEATVWTTIADLTDCDYIHIGQPIKNTNVYILNDDLAEIQPTERGEIYISGDGLAREYLNEPALTEQCFIPAPWDKNEILYRTGDIGEKTATEEMVCIGRMDNQVKVNGYRIELEEIESYVSRLSEIHQCMAFVKTLGDHSSVLGVYYTSEKEINAEFIRTNLEMYLPQYMVPSIFLRVVDFYHTSNGKLDRNRRPMLMLERADKKEMNNDLTKQQYRIMQSIRKALPVEVAKTATLHSNLRALGLNSINYIFLINALENEFNVIFPNEKLLVSSFSSIMDMINYIEEIQNVIL